MKMLAATLIFAGAALAAPAAIGQSQGMPTAALQAAVTALAAPFEPNPASFQDSSLTSAAPDSAFSWVMALAFLGFVVLRRTRSGL